MRTIFLTITKLILLLRLGPSRSVWQVIKILHESSSWMAHTVLLWSYEVFPQKTHHIHTQPNPPPVCAKYDFDQNKCGTHPGYPEASQTLSRVAWKPNESCSLIINITQQSPADNLSRPRSSSGWRRRMIFINPHHAFHMQRLTLISDQWSPLSCVTHHYINNLFVLIYIWGAATLDKPFSFDFFPPLLEGLTPLLKNVDDDK